MTGAPRVVAIAAGSHIFGAAHVPALLATGAEVVGVYDVDPARASAVAAPHGWRVATTLAELLSIEADAAVIAAPHPLHAELAEQALAAGRHLLVEKPLAARPSEARSLVAAAEAADRTVAVALQHRFRGEVEQARALVAAGRIGRLQRAVVVATYPKRAAYYRAAPWRGTWAGEGGGVLLNQGQHDLDTLVHIVGSPSRTMGWARTRLLPIEAEDSIEAMLEWPDGALGSVRISSVESDPSNRIELLGTGGALRITPGRLELALHPQDFAEFVAEDGGAFDAYPRGEWQTATYEGGTHAEIYRDFFAAIATGRAPRGAAADALPALELTTAIILSSWLDRPVPLPIDAEEYDRMLDQHIAAAADAALSGSPS